MAKKEDVNFDDLNLDDIDFGGDFDFNTDGEIKFDADDSRSPIESFVTSAKDGLKDRIMDRGLIRRLLSFALPKGYSQAFNAYDSLSNGVADIYKDNAAEMQPYMAKTSRFLKQQNPMFKRLLPRGTRDALEASENETTDWGSGQDDALGQNIAGIDKLLGMEARNKLDDTITTAQRDVRERKQFATTTGINIEMGKSLGRLVQYQDTVLINYHRKSLELKYRHLDVSMRMFHGSEVFHNDALDLMKAIGKNTALPDFVKMRGTEIIKEQLRHRLANNVIGSAGNFARKHLGNITKNLSQSLGGALGTINAAGSMGAGMSKAAMAGEAAGSLVSSSVADMLEYLVKESLTKLGLGKEAGYVKSGGRWLQDKLSGASQRLNDYARSQTTNTGLKGQFEDWVKRQLDSYTITDKINGGGVYALDETAKFDNLFHKTVVEIIPGQLSSMEKWLRTIATGQEQEEHAYSHYTGGFVTRDVLNKQHIDIGLKAGAGDAVRKQLDMQLRDMHAENLSAKARRTLRARLLTDMSSHRDFNPQTYVKPETWTSVDPEVAEELVEFFAETYGINIDGEYDNEDEEAAERRTKARAGYLDLAPRIADYTGRMAGLSEVIGRRSWRELGLSKYDGRTGDTIDPMAIYDMIANEGGDEFTVGERKEEEKPDPFKFSKQGIKDGLNARADLARKKMEEAEAEQKRLAEEAAKAAEEIRVDVDGGKTVDLTARPAPAPTQTILGTIIIDDSSMERLSAILSQSMNNEYEIVLPDTLETVDTGTHDRLDGLVGMLDSILGAIKANDPCKCEGRAPANRFRRHDPDEVEGSDAGEGMSRWARIRDEALEYGQKGKQLALGRADEARKWLTEQYDAHSDEIDAHRERYMDLYQTGRDRALGVVETGKERAQGFIDAHRDEVLEKIETGKELARTGIETGKEHFKTGLDTGRDLLQEGIEKGRERLREELEAAPDRIEAGKERLREGLETGRKRLQDGLDAAPDHIAAGKERLREGLEEGRGRLKDGYEQGRDYLKDSVESARERLRDGIEIGKEYLRERAGDHREWFTDGFETGMKYGGGRGGPEGGEEGEEDGTPSGPGKRRLRSRIWSGMKQAPGMAFRGLGRYLGWSYRKLGQGLSGGYSLGKMVVGAPFKSIKGLGVTDVHVMGDPEPSLTAKDIRRGFYFDVKTKKVIEQIKDITGPVKNRDGETVLTQEDFDKGLMSGDGESLAGWGLRKSLSAGLGLAGLTGRYIKNSYGLMGKIAKGAFNLAYDQFVQFDAYFPGDEEPRIRSSLLKKGFYRDKDGAPLTSLKDITGPVYDIEDNEVISQEELDKYKSLYTRNGSLLFTVGRGLVSGAAWAGDLAKRGIVGYAKMTKKFYKGLWKGAKAIGRGVKSLGIGLAGKMGFKLDSPEASATGGMYGGDEELHTAVFEVGIAQLNMQRSIFELLRDKFKMQQNDKWDLDGDGDRDNSWKDILSRRKAAKDKKDAAKGSSGGSEDIVKAIDKLGKNLDGAIDELGDRVEESNEDGLLDQAADIGDIADGWNSGDGEGRRGRRRGRGGRGGRGGLRGKLGRMGTKVKGIGGRIAGSRAAGWAVRGGIMAAEGAATVGSAIMGSSMMAGLGTAAMAAGTTAMGWLGAGATAVAGILSAPVVLAAAAIAAVGYVGYRWYKSSQAKDNPIFYLRMTQYGVAPTDETRVKQMLALEELLLPGVTFVGDKASIDAAKVSIPKLMEILEIEEGEDRRLKRALKWLAGRFRPVFLAHVGGMKKTVKSTKLSEADQLIDGSVIKEFLEIVDLKNFTAIYQDIMNSPFDSTLGFGGVLDCGASDVEDAFKLVRSKIKETEKPEAVKSQDKPVDPKEEGGELGKAVAAAGVGAMAGVANAAKMAEDPDALDIGGMVRSGVDLTTALPAAAAGVAMTTLPLPANGPVSKEVDGATVSTEAPLTPAETMRWMQDKSKAPLQAGMFGAGIAVGGLLKAHYQVTAAKVKAYASSLDIPTAVRYLEYGLTSFDDEKCKQLQQVEDLYWDFLRFNGYDNALIDGDILGLEETVTGIFTPSGGNAQNVVTWLRYRFMPTFLQYAISVRRRLPGDVRQANRNLTSSLMRDVLMETTQAVDAESGSPVWLNVTSPWPNYVLGKDASVTTPYIDALPQSLKELAVDGLKNLIGKAAGSKAEESAPAIEDSNLNQGSPNQEKEEGGIFSNAVSSMKKFFGFGSDPGGTASGGGSASSGGPGYTPIPGVGGGHADGPPANPGGVQVAHPGGGTGGDINTLPESNGSGWDAMKGIITGAAKMAGFDPFIAANVAAVESRFQPRAGAGTSSAKGLYQFVNGTWQDMLRKYGKKYGIAPNTHQFDPRANALMGMEYLKENYAYLKEKVKGPITDTALYSAHFLGAGGARKFLSAPGSANAEDVVGASAVKANASVFREPTGQKGVYGRVRTVAETMAELDKRMKSMQKVHDLKPGQQPVVAEGTEAKAADNAPQNSEGEPGGAAPEVGMDTAAAQGGGGNATGQPKDVGAVANGAASGSSAAVNTQAAPEGGAAAMPTSSADAPSSAPTSTPTISQSTTAQNQNTTAASTAEMAASVGPLLQQQLEVQQSMDGSLKEIREYLKAMSQQQPMQQAPGEPQAVPVQQQAGRQWAPEDEPVATQPRGTSTSTGSGRNPINTRRNNAVT
jgi:hypothetical protein